ncbi:MAG TPA: histidine--tRNA ligase [Leucothrix mucor]|nr:histidine--tRNA ligase [Leucothrix mucor]
MAKNIQSVRGMRDILPDQSASWQFIENTARQLFNSYGYKELRTPIIEPTDLFVRTIGEVTDIVEKEMYTFQDRNEDSLTLRPEGTAGCVRAGIQHGLLHNQQQRIWYTGPMFRHERPQKGRYRQFYQAGIETYGIATPDIDAEVIAIAARLWKLLGLDMSTIRLEINSLGSNEARDKYRNILINYFSQHEDQLDEDSKRRLHKNPLRILDTKNPALKELVANAPDLLDYLDDESKAHFEGLKQRLDSMGIAYQVNSRLVRGIDYYNRTVFEWITEELGAQGTICAGGRYDGLVKQIGGRDNPACGFGIGLDRLQLLLEEKNTEIPNQHPHAYFVLLGEQAELAGVTLSETIRNNHPALRLLVNGGAGSFKSQLKRADKSNASYAFILGESEVAAGEITIKPLQEDSQKKTEQVTLSQEKLADYISTHML